MATYTQPRTGSWGPLRAFGFAGYPRLWCANILSYTPRWMQMTLVAWLVLELTDSPWLVALVGFFASTPMLFLGLVGGVLADRTQRKRLIVFLQGMNVAVSLIMTLLLASGAIQVWHAYTAICLNGVAWALGFPARRALIFDLLGTSGITNAVALDSVGMNASRMVGPALAGALISLIGLTGGFVVITVCYVIGLILLATLRVQQIDRPERRRQSIVRNVTEGFRYIRTDRVILGVIVITVLMNFLLFPYMQMVPVFARDVLHVGPLLMGVLLGAEGFGALVGSVVLASVVNITYHGRYFVIGSMIALIAMMIFSMSQWYIISFPTLFIVGLGTACFGTMQSTIVMIMATEEMRGRALGVVSLAIGAGPLGSLFLGAVADTISPVFAVRLNAMLGIVTLICTALVLPSILDRTQPPWRAVRQEAESTVC